MTRTPYIHIFALAAFLVNAFGPICPIACSAEVEEFRLPVPGVMVHLSPAFNPPILKGIKVHPDDPFRFDFILDKGDDPLGPEQLKDESSKLIKYFLAGLTIPEKDLWVNLSPYEKERIIPQSFGLTEMGRDLLAEDYMLKQITASLIYPEDEVGKRFWRRVYEEAEKKFGTTDIPVNTFNKVWIVPEKAVVYENAQAGTAYVVESKLKVMLEEDYLSLEKHSVIVSAEKKSLSTVHALGSQIVREIVLPELSKEINENRNFAQLRQVYNSLILAAWYKKKIKDSILSQVYADKNKTAGVQYTSTVIPARAGIQFKNDVDGLYQEYLKAFKKGVYNYIKEEQDMTTREMIPRKYFSGGDSFYGLTRALTYVPNITVPVTAQRNMAMITVNVNRWKGRYQSIVDRWKGRYPYDPNGEHVSLLPGGAVLLSDIVKQELPDLRTKRMVVEMGGGMQKVEKISGWDYQKTPFKDIDYILDIMQRIEELARDRKDPNVPIVILDWGCGDGRAVVGLLRELQKREREGRGIANVIVYGFADESDPMWNKAPKETNFVWGTAAHLKERLAQHLHGVSIIMSHFGLEHTVDEDSDLFKRNFLDLHDLLDPKNGVLLIADIPHAENDIHLEGAIRHFEKFFDGRYTIKFMGMKRGADHDIYPSEWRPAGQAGTNNAMTAQGPIKSFVDRSINKYLVKANKNGGKKALFDYSKGERKIYERYFKKNGMSPGTHLVRITSKNLEKIISPEWQKQNKDKVVAYYTKGKITFKDKRTARRMASIIGLTSTSARKDMEDLAKAQELSFENIDPMTKLYGRVGAERLLTRLMISIARDKANIDLVVNMMDIDNFKVINELFGHAQGDDVLRQFSKVLSKAVRSKGSDIVARWGGEEFMVIMPFNNGTRNAKSVLQRVLQKIQDEVYKGDKKYTDWMLNDREKIIQKLITAEKEKTNEDRRKIYEALIFQLALQNPTLSAGQLRRSLPDLKDAIRAIQAGKYAFDRWVVTTSMGSLRIRTKLTSDQKRDINELWSRRFLDKVYKRSDLLLLDAKSNGRNNVVASAVKTVDLAMIEQGTALDTGQRREGGINFNSDKMNLQIKNDGRGIKFHLDPAQLAQFQNAPGFVPVIIHIQPMTNLRTFLGLKEHGI